MLKPQEGNILARKSWADREGIPTGVLGEVYRGIPIEEENRATVYEYSKDGIQELRRIARDNYKSKGVSAVVFGIHTYTIAGPKYAVFVECGFMRDVKEDS